MNATINLELRLAIPADLKKTIWVKNAQGNDEKKETLNTGITFFVRSKLNPQHISGPYILCEDHNKLELAAWLKDQRIFIFKSPIEQPVNEAKFHDN